MIGISCLVKNTALATNLKDMVEYIGYSQVAAGKDASISSVYNIIRKSGIEVDMNSVGHLYNEVLPKTYREFSSDNEVNNRVLHNFNEAIRQAADLEDKTGEKQIGEAAPEQHVATGIVNMFTNANIKDETTKSDMRELQDALWKGVKRKLNLKEETKPTTKEAWTEVLSRALGYEKIGIRDVNGKLNGITDLYSAMKDELSKVTNKLLEKGDFDVADRWLDMTGKLQASTYNLLFSEKEAKDLLHGILKQGGFVKELSNGQQVINWNKLAGDVGDIQTLRNNVESVLANNGFNNDVIEGVKNSLADEFEDLMAQSLEKRLTAFDKEAEQLAGRLSKLQKELIRVSERRLRERPEKKSKDDESLSSDEKSILRQIEDEQNKWDKEIKNAKEAKRDYKNLESERNRQFSAIEKLREKLQALNDKSYQPKVPGVAEKDVQEIEDLKEQVSNASELFNKERQIGREVSRNSDLKRLSQLNNLGVFSGQFDRVLNNLLKTSDLQQADMADLKQLADAASNLYREIDNKFGSPIFASRHLQTLQHSIDQIIARNIANKSTLLKVMSGVKAYFDVLLTGMLMRPFTILENLYSGVKANIEPLLSGQKLKKEDYEIAWKMLGDVTRRGQAFGEEVGNFSPQELFTNSLKWKWKDGSNSDKAKSVLHAIMLPARIGLTGFDSANKVTITNSVFKNSIYKALTQQGMDKAEAKKLMNEALYGKSWDQAKKDAEDLINKINTGLSDKLKVPVNTKTITTFANDLVKANLNANGALTNDVIEAAHKSAYHVAGFGLGHEANNFVSRMVKGYRNNRKQQEEQLIKKEEWNKLAWHRLQDTLSNGMVFRFIGGATNWVRIRFEGNLGLGLATGFMGKWNSDIDFTDKRTIQESLTQMQNARNKISRAAIGISMTAIAYTIGFGIWRLANPDAGDPEKEKQMEELKKRRDRISKERAESGGAVKKYNKLADIDAQIKELKEQTNVYEKIKSNWMGNRLFKKMSPDAMLFHYYADTDKNIYLAALDYITQSTNFGGNFSASAKLEEAGKQFYKGNFDAGKGQLASIIGGNLGLPVWQSGKDWVKLFQWVTPGLKSPQSDYKQPTNMTEGLFGGGALEDVGAFNRNSNITMLPGIGGVALDKFKAHGVETMEDLKKNPNWYKMKDKDGSYILDGDSRVKAQAAAKKYFDQQ